MRTVARFDSIYQQAVSNHVTVLGSSGDSGTAKRGQAGQDLSISDRQLAIVRSVSPPPVERGCSSAGPGIQCRRRIELYKTPPVANRVFGMSHLSARQPAAVAACCFRRLVSRPLFPRRCWRRTRVPISPGTRRSRRRARLHQLPGAGRLHIIGERAPLRRSCCIDPLTNHWRMRVTKRTWVI